ncbi:unnamed protein product, partial [Mesorhabditis belari]|uniref:Iron hydrogenase large subunit C-terminal domain-containing protein n=1 Tax=Mesorhabditis belari TaxID=2138241 RepID=A0AAF3J7Y0_9BILA
MESGDGGGFSGVVRISNVSDFIAPSKNCIIPLNENTKSVPIEEPLVAIGKRKRNEESGALGKKVGKFKASHVSLNIVPYFAKALQTTIEFVCKVNSFWAVKVTLNDCLACSGCITSAETVLIDAQSLTSLLNGIAKSSLSVVSVSPQSVCSIAAQRRISVPEAARLIASYFFSKGVRFVLDSSVGRLFALEQECEELERRQSNKPPILSSICPGFVCYAEKSHGELLVPLLSKVRSPQAIMGAIVKRFLSSKFSLSPKEIFHATVMPCYDKKLEASRSDFEIEESTKEVDCVISSGELDSALDGIDNFIESVEAGWLGDFGRGKLISGSGGSSGGYAEAVIMNLTRKHPNLRKEVNNPQKNLEVTRLFDGEENRCPIVVAKVYGFKNIQNMVRKIKTGKCEYNYVEVMACPGGCGNGGGQIRRETEADREAARIEIENLYAEMYPNLGKETQNEISLEWSNQNPEWTSNLKTNFRPLLRTATNLDY